MVREHNYGLYTDLAKRYAQQDNSVNDYRQW